VRSAIQGILLVNEIAAIANIQHFAQFWRQAHLIVALDHEMNIGGSE
jgi:hypothetical protein